MHAILGRTLKEEGYNVLFARCLDTIPACPTKDMYGVKYREPKRKVIQYCYSMCAEESIKTLSSYGLDSFELSHFLTPAIKKELRNALKNMPDDLRNFTYDGIDFGKLSARNIILKDKILDFESISLDSRHRYLNYIKSSVLCYLLMKEILKKVSVAAVITYNDYAYFWGVRMAAMRAHVKTFAITHAFDNGVDFRTVSITDKAMTISSQRKYFEWNKVKDIPLTVNIVNKLYSSLNNLFNASLCHIYSPKKSSNSEILFERLGLSKSKKLIVIYTSSADEFNATDLEWQALKFKDYEDYRTFPTQIDWIHETINFIKSNPSFELVVRVHPREGKNKREKRLNESKHLKLLKENFYDKNFERCHFVWPEDDISSYDLAELASVTSIYWSTIGIELLRLGIPVISTALGIGPYPKDCCFIKFEPSKEGYFKKLKELTENDNDTLNRIIMVTRWCYYYYLSDAIDLSDVVPTQNYFGVPDYKKPANSNLILDAIIKGKNIADLNYKIIKNSSISEKLEFETHIKNLNSLIYYFINIPQNIELTTDNQYVQYSLNGEKIRKYSPLVVRLINAIKEANYFLKKAG